MGFRVKVFRGFGGLPPKRGVRGYLTDKHKTAAIYRRVLTALWTLDLSSVATMPMLAKILPLTNKTNGKANLPNITEKKNNK